MVNELSDNQRVDRTDNCRFGRREDTSVDTAEDDDRSHDRRQAVHQDGHKALIVLLADHTLVAALFGNQITDEHQCKANQETRNKAALEQVSDGRTGSNTVNNEGNGGRDDNADRTGRCRQTGGEALVVAALDHFRDHDRAHGNDRGRAGTGNRRKEHAADNGSHAETAGVLADCRVGQLDNTARNAAVGHQVTGKHEEGDRQERERIKTRECLLRNQHGSDVRGKNNGNGGSEAE